MLVIRNQERERESLENQDPERGAQWLLGYRVIAEVSVVFSCGEG